MPNFPPNPLLVPEVFSGGQSYVWNGNTWAVQPTPMATESIVVVVVNKTVSTITKGSPVAYDGHLGGIPQVKPATAPEDFILGLASEDLLVDVQGYVINRGKLRGLDTSTYTPAQQLYLGSGALATSGTIPICRVLSVHAVDGVVWIELAGQSSGSSSSGQYGVIGFYPGLGQANEFVIRHVFGVPVNFPAGAGTSRANSSANATANKSYTINNNGSIVGDVSFSSGSSIGAIDFFSATAFVPGDTLTVPTPSTPDATLQDVTITLMGYMGTTTTTTTAAPTAIDPNSSTAASIAVAGEHDYYAVIISVAGTLTVTTTGTSDTYGKLFDGSWVLVAEDEDSGADTNFQIVQVVSPGTYYIEVKLFNTGATGDYTLVSSFVAS